MCAGCDAKGGEDVTLIVASIDNAVSAMFDVDANDDDVDDDDVDNDEG